MDRIHKFRLVSVRDADLDRTLLQTCPVAWRQLGCCYETGRGVGQDLEKAAILYSQAAVEGSTLECVINMAGDHKRLGTGSDAILKKYSFSCSDLARISKVEKY